MMLQEQGKSLRRARTPTITPRRTKTAGSCAFSGPDRPSPSLSRQTADPPWRYKLTPPPFFFDSGGGLSNVQKQVLQIMENGGDEQQQLPGEDLTPQSVRKQLLALEKAVNKNRDLRTKYPTEPEKCAVLLTSSSGLERRLFSFLRLADDPFPRATLSLPLAWSRHRTRIYRLFDSALDRASPPDSSTPSSTCSKPSGPCSSLRPNRP